MSSPRVPPAHGLEIVVSDSHIKKVARIAGVIPSPVVVRDTAHPESGWTRPVLATDGEQHLHDLQAQLRVSLDFHLVHCEDRALACRLGCMTQLRASVPLETPEDLALAYTPGVGRASSLIAQDPERVHEMTGRANRAVVTDGSAVLGLGDLGPLAALPVMEGKAAGTAVTRLLLPAGAEDVTVWPPVRALHPNLAKHLPRHKMRLSRYGQPSTHPGRTGTSTQGR